MSKRQKTLYLFLLMVLLPRSPWALEPSPERAIHKLRKPIPEYVKRVSTARVILADYDLIRRDFYQWEDRSDAEINELILKCAGFMALTQIQQTVVNGSIATVPGSRTFGYRPKNYGRALVFSFRECPGLFDVKGAGALNPQPHKKKKNHRNGLARLGEMIREFTVQKKVQQILDHSGSGINTVGNYAVIDWGFDLYDRGETYPAGALVRQGHRRRKRASAYNPTLRSKNHFLSKEMSEKVEFILRSYGITSAHMSTKVGRELIDLQGTPKNNLVDFGSFMVKGFFDQEAFWYPERKVAEASPIFSPASPGFPQPQPDLQLPLKLWGSTESGRTEAQYDNLYIWSTRLAQDLRAGIAQPEHVAQHFQLFIRSGNYSSRTAGRFHGFCELTLK